MFCLVEGIFQLESIFNFTFIKTERDYNKVMNEHDKKLMIKKLIDIKSSIDYILPDDDNFWENYREDVQEVYNHINMLKELIIKASN